jgi:hypothetical protein
LPAGATGLTGKTIENRAYKQPKAIYRHGVQTIDVFAFSRCAAMALDVANQLQHEHIDMGVDEEMPTIRFLGLFDVVARFSQRTLVGI